MSNRTVNSKQFFAKATDEELEHFFRAKPELFGNSPEELVLTQQVSLIRGDDATILIDTGLPVDNPNASLQVGLTTLSVKPEEIDLVILTHRHVDHVGGATFEGKPCYPNARYVMRSNELEDFRSDTDRADLFQQAITPLEDRGVLEPVEVGTEIAPGVRLVATPGHTSQAASVLIDDSALFLADTWHSPLQVEHPDWSLSFDWDPELAATSRRSIIAQAAERNWMLVVPHTPHGGAGFVREGEGGLHWNAAKAT